MDLKGVFSELGMAEAVWAIRLDRLPLVVGIDSHGRNIFAEVQARAVAAASPR